MHTLVLATACPLIHRGIWAMYQSTMLLWLAGVGGLGGEWGDDEGGGGYERVWWCVMKGTNPSLSLKLASKTVRVWTRLD